MNVTLYNNYISTKSKAYSIYFHQIDGELSEWTTSKCTKSCGKGERTKTRNCNYPSPNPCGKPCPGDKKQVVICNTIPCSGKKNEFCS